MEPNKELLFYIGKDAEWHAKQVFEQGIAYLEKYFAGTPELIPLYSYHSAFWAWWQKQYERRNEMLLRYIKRTAISEQEALRRYNNIHAVNPKEVFPARVVERIILTKKIIKHV